MKWLGRRKSSNVHDATPNARIKRAFEDANTMSAIPLRTYIAARRKRYYPRNPG